MTEDKIPMVLYDTGGTPATCVACGDRIDPDEERYVPVEDPSSRHDLVSAHLARFADDESDEVDDRCRRELRMIWEARLADLEVAVLSLDKDGGGARFFAGEVPLHAGTPLDVYGADGHWLAGRFEYAAGGPPRPWLYLRLGGFDPRHTALELPTDTVVRIPSP